MYLKDEIINLVVVVARYRGTVVWQGVPMDMCARGCLPHIKQALKFGALGVVYIMIGLVKHDIVLIMGIIKTSGELLHINGATILLTKRGAVKQACQSVQRVINWGGIKCGMFVKLTRTTLQVKLHR